MKCSAKKVVMLATINDEECEVKADLIFEDGRPAAILRWGDENRIGMRYVPLRDEWLVTSKLEGVDFDYVGPPTPIPSDLSEAQDDISYFRIA